jgi:hypothetical protein
MNSKSILSIIAAFALVFGTLSFGSAFADNSADQSISQDQSSEQSSFVVSGDDTDDSGNNFSAQFQWNEGNNALGQQDNDEEED